MIEATLITHADGRRFLRTGECDGCGGLASCCNHVQLPLARPLSEDEAKWVNLHPGVSVVGDHIRIDSVCSALENGRCTLFGKPERPAMCVRAPELPQQLLPGCSYTLVELPLEADRTVN